MAFPLSHTDSRTAVWDRYLATAVGLWLASSLVFIFTLPLLPVDETRYLTVAWEMKQSGHWLLPTLNGEPYSHKPPLLFWLINLAWFVGGTEIGVARAVPVLISVSVLLLTRKLARELCSEDAETASLAAMLSLVPVFFVYGSLIMFDQMLTLCILLGLIALWRAAHAPSWQSGALLGLSIGLGFLTKGPVILLHLLAPALLVRFWKMPAVPLSRKQWAGTVAGAVALGVILILTWAVPAAIQGGPEFAYMIFWRQSAGRIVDAFHHQQPFWYYGPVLLVLLLPYLVWKPLWRAVPSLWRQPADRRVIFILSWIVPAIAGFMLFSGKQPHYFLPFLPGFAILAALALRATSEKKGDARGLVALFAVAFLVLTLGPIIAGATFDTPAGFIGQGIARFNPALSMAAGFVATIMLSMATTLRAQALALASASALLITTFAVQAYNHVFRFYDLAPLGQVLRSYADGPIAIAGEYTGELGYLARLERPVEIVSHARMREWLDSNTIGTIVLRHAPHDDISDFTVLYSAAYRTRKRMSIIRAGRPSPPA